MIKIKEYENVRNMKERLGDQYKEKNNMSVAEKSISKEQNSIVEEKSAKEEKKEEKQLEGKKSNTFEEISNPMPFFNFKKFL